VNRAGRLPDPEPLWRIEEAVDNTPFFGVGIGPSLNDFLLQLVRSTEISPLLELTRSLRLALPSPQRRVPHVRPDARHRLLFTWVRQTPRFSDLVLPVIRELGGPSCAVLGTEASMASRLPTGCDFYLENDLGPQHWTQWAAEFARAAPRWLSTLRRLLVAESLPKGISPLLVTALVQQSRQLTTFVGALRVIQPRAVVSEFDRGAFASPLLLAARSLRIPTITMVHGAVSRRGLTPIIADVALCWGEDQVEAFVGAGTSRERLAVTGCQRTGLDAPADADDVRRRLALPPGCEVVALATTNGPLPSERRRFARVFCEAMADRPDVVALMRVHPQERLEDYAEVQRDHPFLRILDDSVASVDETLALASLLVCGESTIAVDAVLQGCPVVLLELDSRLLTRSRLAMGGDGPVVHSTAELASVLDRFIGAGDLRNELADMARRHAPRICAAVGREAARNAADAIEKAASGYGGPVPDTAGSPTGRLPA